MRRIFNLAILLALLICTVSAVLAEPVTLQYKFTKGEVEKYTMSVSGSFSGGNLPPGIPTSFNMSVAIQQRTLEVYADGSAKIRQFIGEPKITGVTLPKGKGQTSMTLVKTISRDGRTLSVTSDMGPYVSTGGIGQSPGDFALLPTMAVEVGKGWMNAIPIPGTNNQIMLNSKLISAGDPTNPQSQSEIEQNYNAHIDLSQLIQQMTGAMARSAGSRNKGANDVPNMGMSIDMSGNGKVLFSPALGKMMREDSSMTGTVRMAVTGNNVSNGTFTMNVTSSTIKTQ